MFVLSLEIKQQRKHTNSRAGSLLHEAFTVCFPCDLGLQESGANPRARAIGRNSWVLKEGGSQ